jgi:hypothetical protein
VIYGMWDDQLATVILMGRISKKTALWALVLWALVPVCLYAFENEPDGFRGMKWGSELRLFSDMTIIGGSEGGFKAVERKNDSLQLGRIPVDSITYGFDQNDRFVIVAMTFQSRTNFEAIKKGFLKMYGEPGRSEPGECVWDGREVWLSLNYEQGSGKAQMAYKPLLLSGSSEAKAGDSNQTSTQGCLSNDCLALIFFAFLSITIIVALLGPKPTSPEEQEDLAREVVGSPETETTEGNHAGDGE